MFPTNWILANNGSGVLVGIVGWVVVAIAVEHDLSLSFHGFFLVAPWIVSQWYTPLGLGWTRNRLGWTRHCLGWTLLCLGWTRNWMNMASTVCHDLCWRRVSLGWTRKRITTAHTSFWSCSNTKLSWLNAKLENVVSVERGNESRRCTLLFIFVKHNIVLVERCLGWTQNRKTPSLLNTASSWLIAQLEQVRQ